MATNDFMQYIEFLPSTSWYTLLFLICVII
jgi:hypothetical protein